MKYWEIRFIINGKEQVLVVSGVNVADALVQGVHGTSAASYGNILGIRQVELKGVAEAMVPLVPVK